MGLFPTAERCSFAVFIFYNAARRCKVIETQFLELIIIVVKRTHRYCSSIAGSYTGPGTLCEVSDNMV
jgi:hypothetical protein